MNSTIKLVSLGVGAAVLAGAATLIIARDGAAPVMGHGEHQRQTAGKPARERTVPRLTPPPLQSSSGALTIDPSDAQYDSIALVHARVMSQQEIFAMERRDETWAPEIERRINDRLSGDLAKFLPDVSVASAECRQTACRTVLKLPDPDPHDALGKAMELVQISALGNSTRIERQPGQLTVFTLVENQWHQPERFAVFMKRMRQTQILSAREDKRSKLPVDQMSLD